MSLKTVHQIIIFAGITISLIFAAFCFLDPKVQFEKKKALYNSQRLKEKVEEMEILSWAD